MELFRVWNFKKLFLALNVSSEWFTCLFPNWYLFKVEFMAIWLSFFVTGWRDWPDKTLSWCDVNCILELPHHMDK